MKLFYGVLIVWTISGLAWGRGRKQKQAPTAICKRGKLLIEDEFKGKDVKWRVFADGAQAKISAGKLILRCPPNAMQMHLNRGIGHANGLVIEFDLYSKDTLAAIFFGDTQMQFGPSAVHVCRKTRSEVKWTSLDITQCPSKRYYPVHIVFEIWQGKGAVSAWGKTAIASLKNWQGTSFAEVDIRFRGIEKGAIVVLDNIKIWAAAPP